MNNHEQWIAWLPNNIENNKYYQTNISLANDSFKIYATDVSNAARRLMINFEESVLIFRVRDIKHCSRELQEIDLSLGKNFHTQQSFFKIKNSTYVRWLHMDSLGRIDLDSNHYAFVFSNCIVDVIEFEEPEIKQIC